MSSRLKSRIWIHFTPILDKKVKCLHCDKTLSVSNKSTCGLIRHMSKKHPSLHNIAGQTNTESKNRDINNSSSSNFTNDRKTVPSRKTSSNLKSPIWLYFTSVIDEQNKVQCLHCDKKLSVTNKSTYGLIRHLNKKHPTLLLNEAHTETHNVDNHLVMTQSIPPTRMSSRLKSPIWLHFASVIDEQNKVQCLHCDKKISVTNKSTCGLIRHLDKKHPNLIVRHGHPKSTNDNLTSDTNLSPSTVCEEKITNNKKLDKIDKQLLKMIIKEYHAFSIVEDKEFMKLIHFLNPAYKLPTRKIISNKLIPALYIETVEKVKKRLKRASSVCLTTDGWKTKTGEIFYAVTAHYIVENNNGIILDSDLLGSIWFTECHTTENIANKINDLMVEWQIVDKVIVIVSDNAAAIKDAVRLGEWRHWGCFAHALNHITQVGIQEIEAVVEKIKIIVSYFKRSSHAEAQLNSTLEDMNLPSFQMKHYVSTVWNSKFDMIKRVLAVKNAIVASIAVLKTSLLEQYEEIQEVDVLSHDEWFIAEQAVQVLEVFDTLTTVISSQSKVSISSILIYLKQLKNHLHTFKTADSKLGPEITNMVSRLLQEIDLIFFSDEDHIEDNDLVCLSTILDPRYKKYGFIDEPKYENMLQKLYNEVVEACENKPYNNVVEVTNEKNTPSKEKGDEIDDLFKHFDYEVQKHIEPANASESAVIEVNKYLQEPLLPRKDASGVNNDPLLWWYQRKHIYPQLFEVVKTKLCIVATSVPCDRIFSHAGRILNEKRENIKANQVSKIVFLNYNMNNSC